MATQTITGLAAGNYTVTMINNFGCRVTYQPVLNSPPITALGSTFLIQLAA